VKAPEDSARTAWSVVTRSTTITKSRRITFGARVVMTWRELGAPGALSAVKLGPARLLPVPTISTGRSMIRFSA
jgi:hypothetical protein